MAKDSKGKEIKEYPKFVKTASGKVRVNSKKEEDALSAKQSEKKPDGWNK